MNNYPYGDNQQINLNWIISEIIALHQRLDPDYTAPTFTQIYPFSETQQLNLDWILTELKALKDLAPTPPPTEEIDEIGQALIAGAYDADTSYQKNDYIVQDGKLYRANAATTGTFDPTKWNEVMLGNDLAIITRWADATNAYLNSLAASNVINDSSVTGATVKDALNNLNGEINIFLESTNDTTDRTSAILALLTNNKKCILGAGVFYTSGIDMPDDSALFGVGDATVLHKTGSGAYVVKMNKNNVVENLCINGNDTVSSTIGTHHGIYWNGNYSSTQDSSQQPSNGKIANISIKNCNGGGITCNNTGYGRDNNILAANIAISNCNTGINIPFFSEYHRFVNVDAFECYYGCINNGGNNSFVNCDFSNSKTIGFLIDNTNSDRTNHAHGTAIGCFFNHVNANAGVGLSLINIAFGFTFSNCHFFGSSIELIDCVGVEITDSIFGDAVNITITRGKGIVFAEDTFGTNPVVTITNNDYVYFDNCTNRTNGKYIPETGQTILSAGVQWNFPCVSGYLLGNSIVLNVPMTAETATTRDIATTSLITTLMCADGTLLTNNEEDVSHITYVQLYSAGRGLAIRLTKTGGWGSNLQYSTVCGSVKITTSEPIK